MMYGHGYGYGYGPMADGGHFAVFGALLMLAFWALVVAGIVMLVVWAVRAGRHPHGAGVGAVPPASLPSTMPGLDEATAIARRRLASGEITPEEYERIAKALNGPTPGGAA